MSKFTLRGRKAYTRNYFRLMSSFALSRTLFNCIAADETVADGEKWSLKFQKKGEIS